MQIEQLDSAALTAGLRHEILVLCALAYDEDLTSYLEWIGAGTHLLARDGTTLVGHVMLVERALQSAAGGPLRTAYVELVATHPAWQGRGIATALLQACEPAYAAFDLAALSPSAEAFYQRLGWETWRGSLFVRTALGLEATPDEMVMVKRTSRTPAWLDLDAPLSVEWREGEIW